MNDILTLNPISYVHGNVVLPGSKSISNRSLLIAAMSCGTTLLKNLLNSDDIYYMLHALKKLGIHFTLKDNNTTCIIQGCSGKLNIHNTSSLFLGNAGTAIRPLTAILSSQNREIVVTGDDRMQERPIKDLIDALKQGGAIIQYIKKKNYFPILIKGGFSGGKILVKSNISSQFLTALLISAPLSKIDTHIVVDGELVSRPYIDITLSIMKSFGITIKNDQYKNFYIQGNQKYSSPGEYHIEGDASSASYFLAAAAIKGKSVRVTGIHKNSIQGDIKFIDILENMGAKIFWGKNYVECFKNHLQGIILDANDIPDTAMTIAMLALFTDGSITKIKNIYNWRVKETDRLHAMTTELRKVGAIVEEKRDSIKIIPPKKFVHVKIDTYNDHRIAMCFSLIALSNQPVSIINPKCVAKTFPNYFTELYKISFFNP
ncbi:3-phosphoshikimate 1-carboxyvinyltransferase [Buchnera aphidicola]|uniref:3-phosphoshikimate 1-carboxyvinyltransferase n=1 Tax=Buchnera aphidicola TaxID=9 RepID=UPI003464339B